MREEPQPSSKCRSNLSACRCSHTPYACVLSLRRLPAARGQVHAHLRQLSGQPPHGLGEGGLRGNPRAHPLKCWADTPPRPYPQEVEGLALICPLDNMMSRQDPPSPQPNMRLPFYQVDAFTDVAFGGNPAAVVLGALEPNLCQRIAAENNLAETAFVEPVGHDSPWPWPCLPCRSA